MEGIFPVELEHMILHKAQFSAFDLARYRQISPISSALVDDRLWKAQGLEIPKDELSHPVQNFGRFMKDATVVHRGVFDTDCELRFNLCRSIVLQSVLPRATRFCLIRDFESDRVVTVLFERVCGQEKWIFQDAFEGKDVRFPTEAAGPRRPLGGVVDGGKYYLLARVGDTLACLSEQETICEIPESSQVKFVSLKSLAGRKCLLVGRATEENSVVEISDFERGTLVSTLQYTPSLGGEVSVYDLPDGSVCVTLYRCDEQKLEYWPLDPVTLQLDGEGGVIEDVLCEPVLWGDLGLVICTRIFTASGYRKRGVVHCQALRGADMPQSLVTCRLESSCQGRHTLGLIEGCRITVHKNQLYFCAIGCNEMGVYCLSKRSSGKYSLKQFWKGCDGLTLPFYNQLNIEWIPGKQLYLVVKGETCSTCAHWMRQFHLDPRRRSRPSYRRLPLGGNVSAMVPVRRHGASHLFVRMERSGQDRIFSYKLAERVTGVKRKRKRGEPKTNKRGRSTVQKTDRVATSDAV